MQLSLSAPPAFDSQHHPMIPTDLLKRDQLREMKSKGRSWGGGGGGMKLGADINNHVKYLSDLLSHDPF